MIVLIIGSTGMLGYSLFSNLSEYPGLEVFGTVRSIENKKCFFEKYKDRLLFDIDVNNVKSIEFAINKIKPEVVINCVGLIKHHDICKEYIATLKINALFPHELARLCDKYNSKLIHFSTDCVFDGKKGNYKEEDLSNAIDLYGKSKCLGEVNYGKHLTLRTSIIGHELNSSVSLLDWFLSQEEEVNGYSLAVFSGLPTCYIAKLLAENILLKPELSGLYHLSVDSIDKYSLLSKVADIYGKDIIIHDSKKLVIDRSLDSSSLRNAIDFNPPSWSSLIEYMYADYENRYQL